MAADHRRKRLNGASIAGCSLWEQHRIKKKKLESSKNDLNAKSLISLEWDGSKKKVVAKREQIGISQRDLRPFVGYAPQHHKILADVFSVPQEIYGLENLEGVLSHETWQALLSENERIALKQFLPMGSNAEEVVDALLSGDNFNFGNPFLKWGASLCLGNLHPDAVLCQEECLKADKKAYYSEIQNYHNDMIKYLQKLKSTWESSQDPEKELLQNIWRSRRKGSRLQNPGDNVAATSESCSLVGEEKACSSDNQNSSAMKGGELHSRLYQKGIMKESYSKPLISSDDAKSRKRDKLHKHYVPHGDGAKYMSYVKISKTQFELVKNMKQSAKSIQYKSLNCVLGNLDMLHVKPYEEFVKEERRNLQEHWLQLANKDIPAAYASWRERESQRLRMTKSLELEMRCKTNSPVEEKENHETALQEQERDGHESALQEQERENHESALWDDGSQNHETALWDQERENHETAVWDQERENHETALWDQKRENHEIALQDQERENLDSASWVQARENHINAPKDQSDQTLRKHESNMEDLGNNNHETLLLDQSDQDVRKHELNVEHRDKENHDAVLEDQSDQVTRDKEDNAEDDKDSGSGSLQYDSPHQLSSRCNGHDSIDMNSGLNHVHSKSDDASPDVSNYSRNANASDSSIYQGIPSCSGRDVWSAVRIPNSYYDPTTHHEYTSTGGLSLPNQVNGEQRTQLIDLEADMREDDLGKKLLHKQSYDSFSSYPNHDRSGLLQSVLKGHGMLPYHHGQKQNRLDFQTSSNVMMEDRQFNGHLQGQLRASMALEQRNKVQHEDYMQQNLPQGIYPEGGGYLIPRQGYAPQVNLQDWNVNPVRMTGPHQAPLNVDGLLPQNWFSGENQGRGGWLSSGGASIQSQSIGSTVDQSLFSVMPNCNQLRSNGPFDSVGSTEQYMVPRSYSMVGGGAPRIHNTFPQTTRQLDYFSGRDTASSLTPDDVGWIMPQNSALHDPMGKPYLRPWNQ